MPKEKLTPPTPPNIKLLGYRALVALDAVETEIELAEGSSHFHKDKGTVVQVGDGRVDFAQIGAMDATRYLKFDFQPGDKVLLSEYAVTPFDAGDGWEYRIVSGSDVIGILPVEKVEEP